MSDPIPLQGSFDEQDLPAHLKEVYEKLTKRGYSEETVEEFARFGLEVARYHRVRAESEDIEE